MKFTYEHRLFRENKTTTNFAKQPPYLYHNIELQTLWGFHLLNYINIFLIFFSDIQSGIADVGPGILRICDALHNIPYPCHPVRIHCQVRISQVFAKKEILFKISYAVTCSTRWKAGRFSSECRRFSDLFLTSLSSCSKVSRYSKIYFLK